MLNSVAVILVNYNGLADTLECIESIKQSSTHVEIVVVDNASKKDETIEINQKYPDVKTFRIDENLGFAGGNNIGIQWALDNGFEYVALLNNDTVIDKDLFKQLLSVADENTVTAPYMYYHSIPEELWYGGGYMSRWTGNAKHLYVPKKKEIPFECSFVTGCCFLAHAQIWKKVGLLDDSYFMYNEDGDFCVRLNKAGCKIKVIPQAKLWHKVGKSSGGSESSFCIYYITRNRLHCVKSHQDFFAPTAYAFSLLTRYLRMLKLKVTGKKGWVAFRDGIKDSKKGIMGPSFRG